ncbi:MAG TPA: SAV_915 family protein [Actinospica sp.]|jgi:hypothetical protein|nr:SAV_915 family protein [Actinospica sp.]
MKPLPLYTPMIESGHDGCVRLALFRNRHGARCAVAFTSPQDLVRVLGADYEVWPLADSVLRELADARGVAEVLIDPVLAAAPVTVARTPVPVPALTGELR